MPDPGLTLDAAERAVAVIDHEVVAQSAEIGLSTFRPDRMSAVISSNSLRSPRAVVFRPDTTTSIGGDLMRMAFSGSYNSGYAITRKWRSGSA